MKERKAPQSCVPLRLYRLVSPALDRRLCSFQKLQTQSPEDECREEQSRAEESRCYTQRQRGKEEGKRIKRREQQEVDSDREEVMFHYRLLEEKRRAVRSPWRHTDTERRKAHCFNKLLVLIARI